MVASDLSRPEYTGDVNLRVILGYQQHAFSNSTQQRFFNNEFIISERCNRMGFRLTGPEIQAEIDGILSEGTSVMAQFRCRLTANPLFCSTIDKQSAVTRR